MLEEGLGLVGSSEAIMWVAVVESILRCLSRSRGGVGDGMDPVVGSR